MNSDLPATGTVALLELLDPLVPDDFINQVWPHGRTGGWHRDPTAAQLFRVHWLSLRSPVHSLNRLVKLLPEQRAWRVFAGLRRQNRVPDVRMLHEFRARLGVAGLRRILLVDGQLFGIPATEVMELTRFHELTRVPLAPPAVAGLLNLRG